MTAVVDFLMVAIPWIGIGLMLAVFTAGEKARLDGKKRGLLFQSMYFFPSICFFLVAFLEMVSKDMADAFIWFSLGILYRILNYLKLNEKYDE